MCGIFFSASIGSRSDLDGCLHGIESDNRSDNVDSASSTMQCACGINDVLLNRLKSRGPDSCRSVVSRVVATPSAKQIPAKGEAERTQDDIGVNLTYCSTVLSLRGDHVSAQPSTNPKTGNLLCWNGEAWRIGARTLEAGKSDTEMILTLLDEASNSRMEGESEERVIAALMQVQGPFAFVYQQYSPRRIFFGRDSIGRRSLLFKVIPSTSGPTRFSLSSIGDGTGDWKEVPASGIFVLDLAPHEHSTFSSPSGSEAADAHAMSNCGEFLERVGGSVRHYAYTSYDKYPKFNHAAPALGTSRMSSRSSAVIELETALREALETRIRTIPELHSGPDISHSRTKASPDRDTSSKVAVLFSGGIDCTVLARLIHDILPRDLPIDLLNVAFENPSSSLNTYALCPDRVTGLASFAELQAVCPGRTWRMVEVNVPYSETLAHKRTVIDLMFPHNTEMDLSIALALYFASRGSGIVRDVNTLDEQPYTTPARVLFSGLGADELFGGYSRHGGAFVHKGFAGLTHELELDIKRLPERNLGRDDRVISHWGREVRFPFLDENVIQWAVEKPVHEKCGFGCDRGEDDDIADLQAEKLVLRLLAYRLGMKKVAREKKRAIQFGARTAKMHGKTKGTALIIT